VNPGKHEGGARKQLKNRRVLFSRYLAVNDVSAAPDVTAATKEHRPLECWIGGRLHPHKGAFNKLVLSPVCDQNGTGFTRASEVNAQTKERRRWILDRGG